MSTTSPPIVSVVMATYNRSAVLRHAIQSVIQSRLSEWELIVVGDHCTDDTAEAVAAFDDPRVRFINLERNCGEQSAPNNAGLRLARGRYVAFLNHDDLYFPDHLGSCVDRLVATGADLVWRVRKNARLSADTPLPDGSYISHIYPSEKDRRHKSRGTAVRVVNYALDGVDGSEEIYRLVTSILDAEAAPAQELAALYHERWEIETALDELKTHLRGSRIVLRSRTPDLVRQEFYGLMMLHYAVRGVMHEAAIKADIDPDRLSFLHAVRVIRRKFIAAGVIPPSKESGMA